MEFSEFAGILKPILNGSEATDLFAQELFENMLNEEDRSILDQWSLESYKKYFNGSTGISGIGKRISSKIDLENFVGYIDEAEDAQRENLLKAFKPHISELDDDNLSQKIAELFNDIIQAAAGTKRKGAQQSADKNEKDVVEEEIVYASEASGAAHQNTYIQNQINVQQIGNNNVSFNVNGTMTINWGGSRNEQ